MTFPSTFSYSVATSEASKYLESYSSDFGTSHVASCWQSITPWFCLYNCLAWDGPSEIIQGKFLLHKDHLKKDPRPHLSRLSTFLTSPHFPSSIAVTQVRKRTQRNWTTGQILFLSLTGWSGRLEKRDSGRGLEGWHDVVCRFCSPEGCRRHGHPACYS